jgi:hypothetical protein
MLRIGDYALHPIYGIGRIVGTGLFTVLVVEYNGVPTRISIPTAKAAKLLEHRHEYDKASHQRFTADSKHVKTCNLWSAKYTARAITKLSRRYL